MKTHCHFPGRLSAVLFLAAGGPVVWARPGAVVSGVGSVVEKGGEVLAASVGDDGSVMLAGLFSRVGSVRVPGIARVKNDGGVDEGFTSGAGIGAPVTVPPPGSAAAVTVPCPVFQNLPGGEVLIGDPPMGGGMVMGRPGMANGALWFVMGGEGALEQNVILAIRPEEPVLPQFVEDGKLVAIVSSPDSQGQWQTKVRRLRLDTGADDAGFSTSLTGTPSQVLPAGGGGMWVLERGAQGQQRVVQLKPGGETAGAFAPVNLATASTSLQTMPAGALAVSASQFELSDVNGTWDWVHRLQFFSADGTAGTPRVQAGGTAPFFIEPDGALLRELSPPAGVNPVVTTARPRVLSRELPNGQVDGGFRGITARRFLNRLADGRLLADGTRRFLTNGNPDPAWSVPAVLNHGTVRALYAVPGGMVIGTGDFTMVDGQARAGVARWKADGVLDNGFVPSAAEGGVQDCAAAYDGSLTILRGGMLQRLRADGSNDAGFQLTTFDPALFNLDEWEEVEPLPGGEVLALTTGWVVRISREGTCTPVMQRAGQGNGRGLRTLADGRFFHAGRRWHPEGLPDSFLPPGNIGSVPLCAAGPDKWLFYRGTGPVSAMQVVMLNEDGSVDASWPAQSIPGGVTAAAGGAGRMIYAAEGNTIVRRLSDGRRDVSFRAPLLERRNESVPEGMPLLSAVQNGGDGAVSALLVHPVTGNLWLAGDFTRTGGIVRTGLAVLDASTPGGYAAWSAAVFGSESESESEGESAVDADGDGLSNFQEYAAGTDPLLADAAAGSAVILTDFPLTVSAPQNPLAPEVFQTLEVSGDLANWRTATGAEAVRKTVGGVTAFELASAAGPRFVRIRYRSQP